VHLFDGDGAVLDVTDKILEIAQRRPIVEVAYDPWRYHAEALRLERDHGLTLVEFPSHYWDVVARELPWLVLVGMRNLALLAAVVLALRAFMALESTAEEPAGWPLPSRQGRHRPAPR